MSEFFRRSLPKWPQLLLVGEPVTREQAMEIILRTDPFLYGDGYTNHRDFQKAFYRDSGLDRGFIFEPGHTTNQLPRLNQIAIRISGLSMSSPSIPLMALPHSRYFAPLSFSDPNARVANSRK